MALSTRSTVLSLYIRVFRIARAWQAQTGAVSDSEAERRYIEQEARSLFRQNQPVGTAAAGFTLYFYFIMTFSLIQLVLISFQNMFGSFH